jgi:hypothetical protein
MDIEPTHKPRNLHRWATDVHAGNDAHNPNFAGLVRWLVIHTVIFSQKVGWTGPNLQKLSKNSNL